MVTKNDTIIKIEHLSKAFGDKVVLDDINLDIRRGEFITLLGPSGCGKTTLLRMIAGFLKPDSGVIMMEGNDISEVPPHRRPLNTVFQRYALFPHLNVYDNIAFGLKLNKVPTAEIETRVRKALKMVSMTDYEDRDVNSLSGGQQQRVAIARAIVNEPKILLLDEPLGALDLKMRKEMQLELKEMHRKLGITFIYVTHDQEEALTMSDNFPTPEGSIIILSGLYVLITSCIDVSKSLTKQKDIFISQTIALADDLIVRADPNILEMLFIDILFIISSISNTHSRITIFIENHNEDFKITITSSMTNKNYTEISEQIRDKDSQNDFTYISNILKILRNLI